MTRLIVLLCTLVSLRPAASAADLVGSLYQDPTRTSAFIDADVLGTAPALRVGVPGSGWIAASGTIAGPVERWTLPVLPSLAEVGYVLVDHLWSEGATRRHRLDTWLCVHEEYGARTVCAPAP